MIRERKAWTLLIVGLALVSWGCSDSGTSPTQPEDADPKGSDAEIQRLVPRRTVVGDTVRVIGTGFGAAREQRDVVFAGASGSSLETQILSWSEEEIAVLVPAGAVPGPIYVREADGSLSGSRVFDLAPRLVSFTNDLGPIFQRQGCQSCHSGPAGSGGLSLSSPVSILAGGGRGPAAVPRESGQSLIMRALVGDGMPRMPLGGAETPAAEQMSIADWIDQGMRSN